jgi:hypothetical protein
MYEITWVEIMLSPTLLVSHMSCETGMGGVNLGSRGINYADER